MSKEFVTKEEFNAVVEGMTGIENVLTGLAEHIGAEAANKKGEEKKLSAIAQLRKKRDEAIEALKKSHGADLKKLDERKEKLIKTFNKKRSEIVAEYKPQIEAIKETSKEEFLSKTEKAGFFVGKLANGPISLGRSVVAGVKAGATK